MKQLAKPYLQGLPENGLADDVMYIDPDGEEIRLDFNENALGTSPLAAKAMAEEAGKAYRYPDAYGYTLRAKLAEKYGLKPSNVTIENGASAVIKLVGDTFICPGDETIFCVPTFGAYASTTEQNGGAAVKLPLLENGFFDLEGILQAVTEKTKIIFLCNPNNPSGCAYTHEEIEAFLKRVPEEILVVLDEAYIAFADDEAYRSGADLIPEYENLIILQTFSKLYGMAGARIGYALSSEAVQKELMKAENVFSINRIGMAGALAALDDEEYRKKSIANVAEGRAYYAKELGEIGWEVFPSKANFVYIKTGMNNGVLAQKLEERKIYVAGYFPHLRITIGTPEQNEKVVAALKAIVNEMQ
ncbi:MAG: histidinol-phosphate transaminase [Eubacteriales bacterium]|nr:histidinol-phosphate transaminase [Eubacteriales bacterium]